MHETNMVIRFANEADFNDKKLSLLCDLINTVYDAAEAGLWKIDALRIEKNELKMLVETKSLLIAEFNKELVGCINVTFVNESIAEFGMLVTAPKYRNIGIGLKMVKTAEEWAIENGRTVMQLNLLIPKNGKHPNKEFLKTWYSSIGYEVFSQEAFEKVHPEKINFLAIPCNFIIFHKKLR